MDGKCVEKGGDMGRGMKGQEEKTKLWMRNGLISGEGGKAEGP